MNKLDKARYEKKIENDKKLIAELKEEIVGLRQLLDCAAANIYLLSGEKGGKCTIPIEKVRDALGRYRLSAFRDKNGNYVIETKEAEKTAVEN